MGQAEIARQMQGRISDIRMAGNHAAVSPATPRWTRLDGYGLGYGGTLDRHYPPHVVPTITSEALITATA